MEKLLCLLQCSCCFYCYKIFAIRENFSNLLGPLLLARQLLAKQLTFTKEETWIYCPVSQLVGRSSSPSSTRTDWTTNNLWSRFGRCGKTLTYLHTKLMRSAHKKTGCSRFCLFALFVSMFAHWLTITKRPVENGHCLYDSSSFGYNKVIMSPSLHKPNLLFTNHMPLPWRYLLLSTYFE